MSRRYPRPGIAVRLLVLLLIQTAALGWMVLDRARLLETGTEALLAVVPVDPRDLLRGDYVTLAFDFSTIRPGEIDGDDEFAAGDAIWVMLDVPPLEPAVPRAVFRERPDDAGDLVALRGRVVSAYDTAVPAGETAPCPAPCRTLRIDYGIERYFVPEGEGRDLEQLRNDARVEIVAAIGRDGGAAIKQLLIDGEPRYDEPLY